MPCSICKLRFAYGIMGVKNAVCNRPKEYRIMSYDGLVMHGVARECSQLLIGARIDRIAQPNKNEIASLTTI